ncbi:MAG: RDD family protein [Methylophilaceae bacterium]
MHYDVSLLKCLAACLYELLSLVAIWLLCTAIFLGLFGQEDTALKHLCLQLFLWVMTGTYFIICWMRTGQTLAAQAWKIRLVDSDGATLCTSQAAIRYVLASISLLVFGLGYLWALVDKEHLFLHDRMLKTHFIKADK